MMVIFLAFILLAQSKIKVFIVLHSHNDVGWLQTADNYYETKTRNIFKTVISLLQQKNHLKFCWSEIFFLHKYLAEYPDQKEILKDLISQGRFEIVGGGWVQNDEALPDLDLVLRQMELGFQYIRKELNVTKVKVGWQLDPFGHSSLTSALFSKMGFESVVFSRIEENHGKLLELGGNYEFLWQPEGYGASEGILAHVLNNHYYPPSVLDVQSWYTGACFENFPVDEYTLNGCTEDLENYVIKNQIKYRTDNQLMLVGGDFFFDDLVYSRQFFKLITDIKNKATKVDFVFATPSEYFEALYKDKKKFNVFKGDLLPHISPGSLYMKAWTGFYTTKPILKKYISETQRYVRAAEILSSLVLNKEYFNGDLAVSAHHDAITGTCKSWVFLDYLSKLMQEKKEAKKRLKKSFKILLSDNDSVTSIKEEYKVMFVFNPLGWDNEKLMYYDGKTKYIKVYNSDGMFLESQMVPWGPVNRFFFKVHLKAFTLHSLFIIEKNNKCELCSATSTESQSAKLGTKKIQIEMKQGLIYSIQQGNSELKCNSSYVMYESSYGGAYTFIPGDPARQLSNNLISYNLYSGPIVQVAISDFKLESETISQKLILDNKQSSINLKISLNAVKNSEVFLRFQQPSAVPQWFYTFNTANVVRRTVFPDSTNRKGNNYYPISGSLHVQLEESYFYVVPSFPLGAGMPDQSHFEFHLHRGITNDDGLGLDQKGDDTFEVEHDWLIGFGNLDYTDIWKLHLLHKNQPISAFKAKDGDFIAWSPDKAEVLRGDWDFKTEASVLEGQDCAYLISLPMREGSYLASFLNICEKPVDFPFKVSDFVYPGGFEFNTDRKKWLPGNEIEFWFYNSSKDNVIEYRYTEEDGKIGGFELVSFRTDLGVEYDSDFSAVLGFFKNVGVLAVVFGIAVGAYLKVFRRRIKIEKYLV